MNCFGRKADMFIKHFNVRKIQLNITHSKCERFQCTRSAIYNQTSLAMNSRLRTNTAEQRRERERKTSVIQMAWDLWILSRVLSSSANFMSVLVPGLVKWLSVILHRTSFLMHLHPIWLYWASPLIANRCLKSTPHPPPTESHGSEIWGPASQDRGLSLCFNFGLSIHLIHLHHCAAQWKIRLRTTALRNKMLWVKYGGQTRL